MQVEPSIPDMMSKWSIDEINLDPKPGKKYWKNCHREWREEFIYFLMVDRFHDDLLRKPTKADHHKGFGTAQQLTKTCGGTLRGIIHNLDYIERLGCSALWLSPIFENNPESYHGYAIQNYLEVDKRFGTKDDLEELVDEAHKRDMRVFLDIVLHHSGNNWFYPEDVSYYYYNGATFPFGGWKSSDLPIPFELHDPQLYGRKGQIRNFDSFPETREGDFMSLKTFRMDDSDETRFVEDILLKVHCYWIREVDIDGFRLDAVKHMSENIVSNFCSHVREYAYMLGKRNFFLFGELVGSEEMYNHYIGPKTTTSIDGEDISYGLNSVLDFPLYHILPDVIKGLASPGQLIERYQSLHRNALGRGEFGEFLVTFLDNHDQVGQTLKNRFGNGATEEQIIAGVGFLLCALGTPCIYYGTEQGFDGSGTDDSSVREAMFNMDDTTSNALDFSGEIYNAISKIAAIRKKSEVLRFGRMHIRRISTDGVHFHFPDCAKCLLAFSRVLFDREIIVAYNTSTTEKKDSCVIVTKHPQQSAQYFKYIYGDSGRVNISESDDGEKRFIRLKLKPMQFVILSDSE